MKRTICFSLIIILALLFTSCANQLKKDVQKYINDDLPTLVEYENTATVAYGFVTGDNYKNDVILYNVLNDIIVPNYLKLKNGIESFTFQTKELRGLNENYIDIVNTQYNAFLILQSALENQSRIEVIDANERLDKAKRLYRQWQVDFGELCKKVNVSVPDSRLLEKIGTSEMLIGTWSGEMDGESALIVINKNSIILSGDGEVYETTYEYNNSILTIYAPEGESDDISVLCFISGNTMNWIFLDDEEYLSYTFTKRG
ncbi:hypothetical protein FACS189483_10250 [Spirochaetia bacterium]|nr:hypothetical protein FACS189483_10250 [Spirochaetia bacterium]